MFPQLLALALLSLLAARTVYRLWFHPLSHLPGPALAAASSLFLNTICYLGVEGRVLRRLHRQLGTSVLRVGPNSVSVSDGEAVRDIYIAAGGFLKDGRYANFSLGPVETIFSSRSTSYRDLRAKAVAPLFSPPQVRAACGPQGTIGALIAEFLSQLGEFRREGARTDLLDLCARLSIDVVTGYLLGEAYGGLTEHAHLSARDRQLPRNKLTANPFIHAIVAFARFSLLPHWAFKLVYSASQRLSPDHGEVADSFVRLDRFVERFMAKNPPGGSGGNKSSQEQRFYHQRLVRAGVSEAEAGAQSKAIVFAGADSTAVMLATTLFHLVQNGAARSRLLSEIREARATPNADLPFLRAVVREGLRLGMANPTRLTRVVGPGGLRVGGKDNSNSNNNGGANGDGPTANKSGGVFIPPGAVVGCAAYTLHHDPDVFPEPFSFRPERWMDDGTDRALRRPGMTKNLMPFGAGPRACIGKNLALQQLHDTVLAVVDSELLEGAVACGARIELAEWFNGDIKGHCIDIDWKARKD